MIYLKWPTTTYIDWWLLPRPIILDFLLLKLCHPNMFCSREIVNGKKANAGRLANGRMEKVVKSYCNPQNILYPSSLVWKAREAFCSKLPAANSNYLVSVQSSLIWAGWTQCLAIWALQISGRITSTISEFAARITFKLLPLVNSVMQNRSPKHGAP